MGTTWLDKAIEALEKKKAPFSAVVYALFAFIQVFEEIRDAIIDLKVRTPAVVGPSDTRDPVPDWITREPIEGLLCKECGHMFMHGGRCSNQFCKTNQPDFTTSALDFTEPGLNMCIDCGWVLNVNSCTNPDCKYFHGLNSGEINISA